VEGWYANLLAKILISIAHICQDLLDTTEKEALPAAAWNSESARALGMDKLLLGLTGLRLAVPGRRLARYAGTGGIALEDAQSGGG
jgi:hypothetical protein